MTTLNITSAAKMMQVHPQTVLDMIGAGVLPAARIGRAYVLLEKDIMAHIEAMIVRQTAQRMRAPQRKARTGAMERHP